MVGHCSLEAGILGSTPSPATKLNEEENNYCK